MTEQIVGGLIGLAIGVILIALFALIFRWLWNTTMPDVFGIKQVTYWQAIKILVLASILFGGHRAVQTPPMDTAPVTTETPSTG